MKVKLKFNSVEIPRKEKSNKSKRIAMIIVTTHLTDKGDASRILLPMISTNVSQFIEKIIIKDMPVLEKNLFCYNSNQN